MARKNNKVMQNNHFWPLVFDCETEVTWTRLDKIVNECIGLELRIYGEPSIV